MMKKRCCARSIGLGGRKITSDTAWEIIGMRDYRYEIRRD